MTWTDRVTFGFFSFFCFLFFGVRGRGPGVYKKIRIHCIKKLLVLLTLNQSISHIRKCNFSNFTIKKDILDRKREVNTLGSLSKVPVPNLKMINR